MDEQGGDTVDKEVDKEDREAGEELQNVKKLDGETVKKITPWLKMFTRLAIFYTDLSASKIGDILQLGSSEDVDLCLWLVHFFCCLS